MWGRRAAWPDHHCGDDLGSIYVTVSVYKNMALTLMTNDRLSLDRFLSTVVLLLQKSMTHYFSRVSSIVCVRHLRENVTKKLDDVLSKTLPIRRTLIQCMFGDD